MNSLFSFCKRPSIFLFFFIFLSVSAFPLYAEAQNYPKHFPSKPNKHRHKDGICEEYIRGLYASERYEFYKMHERHLETMRPLYREYKRLNERDGQERRKRDLEREITRLDRNFAKKVSKRFGETLYDGNKIIQHGEGLDSPCGYSGY